MNQHQNKLPTRSPWASLVLAAILLGGFAAPAIASIDWIVKGTAKLGGGLVLGTTTITATGTEINTLKDEIASVTMTDAATTGSDPCQFTFKNAAGTAVSGARAMTMYTSDATGTPAAAVTSYATLTNGTIVTTKTGAVALAVTKPTGLLGCTVTNATSTVYLSWMLPNGKVITSPPISPL